LTTPSNARADARADALAPRAPRARCARIFRTPRRGTTPPSRLARARAREIDARGRPPRAHAPSSVRAAPPSARRPSVRARDAIARSPNSRTVSASARAVRRPSRARVADVAARSNVATRGDRDVSGVRDFGAKKISHTPARFRPSLRVYTV
jgi:hypothetical protein